MNISEKTSIEALSYAVQALALCKTIRDIILTDEQRKLIPDLYKKHAADMAKQCYERLGLPYKEPLLKMPQNDSSVVDS